MERDCSDVNKLEFVKLDFNPADFVTPDVVWYVKDFVCKDGNRLASVTLCTKVWDVAVTVLTLLA